MILVGDVGGTKTALALVDEGAIVSSRSYPSANYETFIEAFLGKGRFRPVLEAIPVRVVVSDTVALLGAARAAVAR